MVSQTEEGDIVSVLIGNKTMEIDIEKAKLIFRDHCELFSYICIGACVRAYAHQDLLRLIINSWYRSGPLSAIWYPELSKFFGTCLSRMWAHHLTSEIISRNVNEDLNHISSISISQPPRISSSAIGNGVKRRRNCH